MNMLKQQLKPIQIQLIFKIGRKNNKTYVYVFLCIKLMHFVNVTTNLLLTKDNQEHFKIKNKYVYWFNVCVCVCVQ